MKNYLEIFLPVGLAVLLGSLTLAFAQTAPAPDAPVPPPRPEFGRMPPPPNGLAPGGVDPRALRRIGLTAEQAERIKTLRDENAAAAKPLIEELRAVERSLRDLNEPQAFDETAARALLNKRGELQTELELRRMKTDAAVFELLTADQIAALTALKPARPELPPPGARRPPQF